MPTKFIATYPSLQTQKGTLIRLTLGFSDGRVLRIEPLHKGVGGVSLLPAVANDILEAATPLAPGRITLIAHDASIIEEHPISDSLHLTSIASFVVYPNGQTWDGPIFAQDEKRVGLIIWSWELAHRVKRSEHRDLFQFSKHWSDTPTTVGFFDNSTTSDCTFIVHSCPNQCDRATKLL